MIVALIVACALFMQNLDSTVIATALPAIAASLRESPLRLNLAITSYMLSLAVFIPLSGWLADRYGARTVFRAAILVFVLGSVGCGLSQSLRELIAARIVQGVGGAMMTPVGRLVLLRAVPKADFMRATAYVTVPALIGPVIGPPLGGLIVTYTSWRWIFFINVPVGLLGIALVWAFVDNSRGEEAGPLDIRGFVLAALALAGFMTGFEMAARGTLPGYLVAALLVGGAICTALYVVHARRAANPIIDLALMRIPTFALSTTGGGLFRVGIGAVPFLVPLMLQIGFGLNPVTSGVLTLATAAGALAMKLTATPIVRALGFRRVLIVNSIVSGAFIIYYGLFEPTTPQSLIFIALLAGGFFRSLQFTCLNTLCFADVPPALMSRASTLSAMAQQVCLSLGVAVGALLLQIVLTIKGQTMLGAGDFMPAFIAVGALTVVSAWLFMPLSPQAGAEMSGHRPAQPAPADD